MIIDYMLIVTCKKVMVIKLICILCANNNYAKFMISNKHLVTRVSESFILVEKYSSKLLLFNHNFNI